MRDVRMIERREHLRFPLQAGESIGIVGEVIRQHLQRDISQELRVPRAEDGRPWRLRPVVW